MVKHELHRVIVGLLAVLVLTNVALFVLLRSAGPLIGLVFYVAFLIVVLRPGRRDYRPLVAAGLVGLAVHLAEVLTVGWANCVLLVALNLVLPAVLAAAAWAAHRGVKQLPGGM